MTTIAREVKARWGELLDAISQKVMAFAAEYARSPADRQFWAQAGMDPPSADATDLDRKRQRWRDLWCTGADMIAAREAEHVRSAPNEAAWASRAAAFMHARLLELQRKLHFEHLDMPEYAELTLDPQTGKHHPRLSPLDVLEALHYDVFEDPENAADDAAEMTEAEFAEHVASGQRFRDFLDSLPEAQARARARERSSN